MGEFTLFLSFPGKRVARLKRRLGGAGELRHYLYLGRDYKKRRQLEEELGSSFVRLDISKLQEEVANALRNEHIAWIDQLNRRYGQDIEWWFGPIAARNIFTSNLFQYSCYLEIIERLWAVPHQRPELIFVESTGLLKAIRKWASEKSISIEILAKFRELPLFKNYFYSILKLGYFCCVLMARIIACYISRRDCQRKDWPRGKVAILDTFIHNFSLDQHGNFHDVNFPKLYEYLAENGLAVLVHPVLFGFGCNYFSIYRRLRRSSTHFLLAEDHLRLSDYLMALTYPFRTLRRKLIVPRFRNFDLLDIVKDDLAKNLAYSSSLLAVLTYCLFKRLGKLELPAELLISWYENQVIDKALILGFRQAFPQARIIGAQIFLYSPNLLYLFPVPSEVEAKVAPDVMLEMSDYLCHYAQTFTKAIPCYVAASVRYAYIFNQNLERLSSQETSTLLILLPYDLIESVEMLETIKRALERIPKNIRLLIKCHPCYSPSTLKRAFSERKWPARFEFYQGSLQQALHDATVTISSNSSTMAEAAARGIPVIFLERQTVLNHNVLDGLTTSLITGCFTEDDLVAGINKYINASPEEIESYRLEGEQILKLFFSPVNEKNMRPFLGENC